MCARTGNRLKRNDVLQQCFDNNVLSFVCYFNALKFRFSVKPGILKLCTLPVLISVLLCKGRARYFWVFVVVVVARSVIVTFQYKKNMFCFCLLQLYVISCYVLIINL